MRRLCNTALVFAALLAISSDASAQPRKKLNNPRKKLGQEFAKAPAVGSRLPDVSLYDAAGKPFPLSQLKGSHTVLVFGCLT